VQVESLRDGASPSAEEFGGIALHVVRRVEVVPYSRLGAFGGQGPRQGDGAQDDWIGYVGDT